MKKLLFSVLIFAGSSYAGVNDGLVFSLDLSRGDANANGRADAAEIGDRMSVSATTPRMSDAVKYIDEADYQPVEICPVDVPTPYFGAASATNRVNGLRFFQTTATIDGVAKGPGDYVHFATPPVTSNATVFLRFRWNGNNCADTHNIPIVANGYAWTSPGYGWLCGIYGYWSNLNEGDLFVMVGQKTYRESNESGKIRAGEWYDVVFTLEYQSATSCRVTYYRCRGLPDYHNAVTCGSSVLEADLTKTASRGFWLGGENYSAGGWIAMTANNAKNAFRGTIADVRVWNRVLTEREVRLLMTGATGEKWTVGAANGSADEFGHPSEVSATYDPQTGVWKNFPKQLDAARPETTLSASLSESEVGLPLVLKIVPILSGEATVSCPADVLVNGALAASVDLAQDDQRQVFLRRRFVHRNADGKLAVTIRRTSAGGVLGLDAVSLSGSFAIGTRNKTNSEFTSSKFMQLTYAVGDANMKHFPDSLWHAPAAGTGKNTSVYSNATVLAQIPLAATANRMTLRAVVNCQAEPYNHVISLYLNGQKVTTWTGCGVAGMEEFTHTFQPGEVPAGLNELMLSDESVFAGASGNRWAFIDCVQLETEAPPIGMLLLLK